MHCWQQIVQKVYKMPRKISEENLAAFLLCSYQTLPHQFAENEN